MVPRVLICADHYLPGWKAGGPVRAIEHLVGHLGDSFRFDIVTSDRDLGDPQRYPGVRAGVWERCGKGRVRYLSPSERSARGWRDLLVTNPDYDLVYLNSLFSRNTMRILALRRAGRVPDVPYLLAPRGELQRGALSLKLWRKAAWLALSRGLRLYERLHWQAATDEERADISDALALNGASAKIHVAPDLPLTPAAGGVVRPPSGVAKRPGHARVVFISRISRKKNLDYALRVLSEVSGSVDFDIYGPVEDQRYWRECQVLMRGLPCGVRARYRGVLAPSDVPTVFATYDLFFFPTRGESFGHVVAEALQAGCPVLISDRTPWRGLAAARAGWDLPLERPDLFAERLAEVADMNETVARTLCTSAASHAEALFDDRHADRPAVEANRRLFLAASGSGQDGKATCSM